MHCVGFIYFIFFCLLRCFLSAICVRSNIEHILLSSYLYAQWKMGSDKKIIFLQSLRFLFAGWKDWREPRRSGMPSPGESLLGSDFCFCNFIIFLIIIIDSIKINSFITFNYYITIKVSRWLLFKLVFFNKTFSYIWFSRFNIWVRPYCVTTLKSWGGRA